MPILNNATTKTINRALHLANPTLQFTTPVERFELVQLVPTEVTTHRERGGEGSLILATIGVLTPGGDGGRGGITEEVGFNCCYHLAACQVFSFILCFVCFRFKVKYCILLCAEVDTTFFVGTLGFKLLKYYVSSCISGLSKL